MSNRIDNRISFFKDWSARFLTGWFIAVPLILMFLRTTAPDADPLRVVLLAGLCLILLSLMLWNRWCLLLSLGVVLILAVSWGTRLTESTYSATDFLSWAALHVTGWQPMQPDYEDIFILLSGLIFSLGVWITAVRFRLYVLLLVLQGATIVYAVFFHQRDLLSYVAWFLTGWLLIFVQTSVRKKEARQFSGKATSPAWQALFLLPLLAAVLLFPIRYFPTDASSFRTPAVVRFFNTLGNWIGITELYGDQPSSFSISDYGYYMDENHLGGSIIPSNAPVLEVRSQFPVLLRGSVFDTYTGTRWTHDEPLQRYDMNDVPGIFDDVFGVSDEFRRTFPAKPHLKHSLISVRMLRPMKDGVLFTANKLHARILLDATEGAAFFDRYDSPIAAYTYVADSMGAPPPDLETDTVLFNLSREVFSNRPLDIGATYVMSASVHVSDPDTIRAAIERARHEGTPILDRLSGIERDKFLALPDTLPASVRETANRIAGFETDPYERIQLIEEYLRFYFRYSLTVPAVPAGADFVAHFMDTKVGYCTYFATTAAVLARCMDIPSRYVEGFAVPVVGSDYGPVTITGEQAHAWTEMYIDELGWVVIDPTPGGYQPVPPTPVVSPTTAPTAAPTDPETTEPFTPTPLPTEPGATERIDKTSLRPVIIPTFAGMLLLVLCLLLYRAKARREKPDITMDRYGTSAAFSRYWDEITTLMRRIGPAPETGETTQAYFVRWLRDIHNTLKDQPEDDLSRLAGLHVLYTYSQRNKPTPNAVVAAYGHLNYLYQISRLKKGKTWTLLYRIRRILAVPLR